MGPGGAGAPGAVIVTAAVAACVSVPEVPVKVKVATPAAALAPTLKFSAPEVAPAGIVTEQGVDAHMIPAGKLAVTVTAPAKPFFLAIVSVSWGTAAPGATVEDTGATAMEKSFVSPPVSGMRR